MAYQTTTRTSYGQRLTGSFKGIATGFLLFIAGTILLFWNEGNFVRTKASLLEAEAAAVIVEDVSSLDPSLNGSLIHAIAFADTEDILVDNDYGVTEKAIALKREVEYYQYEERSESTTRDRIGGGQETVTTYYYDLKWVSKPINSANFEDPSYYSSNFVRKNVEAQTIYAQKVSFGGYQLPAFMIKSIRGNVPVDVHVPQEDDVAVFGNTVYYGRSSSSPSVGDVRVMITKVVPAQISIMGKVVNNTFEHYVAKNGKTFSAVEMGSVSAQNMFADAHSSNKMWTWILRFVGLFLVIGGLKSMFSILPAIFKVLPFLGNIVGAGVGLVCAIVGGAWSLIIIAISWLWYRPLIGIILLVISFAGIWLLKKKAKEKS
ncbi:MAG: TMEM43 family protein [Prevotellaceae bacterium]|jgi:hypothetical protein|nr:TMEM43 family protein [Prevotellaceae bacterium]